MLKQLFNSQVYYIIWQSKFLAGIIDSQICDKVKGKVNKEG